MNPQITINGAPRPLAEGETLADVVAALGQPPQSLATAVNGDFVPRSARDTLQLRDGDAVLTFQPIQGG